MVIPGAGGEAGGLPARVRVEQPAGQQPVQHGGLAELRVGAGGEPHQAAQHQPTPRLAQHLLQQTS